MCGRYTLTTPGGRALADRFDVTDTFDDATLTRFNVCPTEPVAIVTEDGQRTAQTVRWGLVPPWAHELGKGFQPINARSETAASKPPFAELWERPERRCLVLADGWYEWLKAEKKGGDRIPFRYTVDAGAPFAFAGLWGRRRIGSELVHSALILTCAANRVCAPVHDRMPCVLAGPDEEAAWLAGESDGLLGPLDDGRTNLAPANPAVNKAGVEGAELLVVPEPSEPAQLSLDT
ncbi:MAG TPA: SOS response-associated peptidase [Solirubrobacteraceae bacterium]|nr:SOS response-associated peptidase [Solirubrobacteraceae bacterium]